VKKYQPGSFIASDSAALKSWYWYQNNDHYL